MSAVSDRSASVRILLTLVAPVVFDTNRLTLLHSQWLVAQSPVRVRRHLVAQKETPPNISRMHHKDRTLLRIAEIVHRHAIAWKEGI